jgi:hypothetical protein
MQEGLVKRPNLGIMGIEEGEKVQAKGTHNVFTLKKPKSQESLAHSGTGILQDTKQT